MDSQTIHSKVSERYSAAVKSPNPQHSTTVAKAFGYSDDELSSIPKDANLGLSCGHPLAIATLKEGETVVDFGSGAGLDVFLAAKKVGAGGKAIGVDMNKDMLAKARRLCAESGSTNVEFVESRISEIPLPSGIADCIISNCVVNLVPEDEKQLVFNEIFRLLRQGGRVAISDILAKKPLPQAIRNSMSLYTGCIAGASQVSDYRQYLESAGFKDVVITDMSSDLNVYLGTPEAAYCATASNDDENCCGITSSMSNDLQGQDLNEWAGSFKIYALKH